MRKVLSYFRFFYGSDRRWVEKFVLECNVQNLNEKTILRYLSNLKKIREKFLRKNFFRWDIEDAKLCVARINQTDFSGWTKYNYRSTIRKFFQIVRGFEWDSRKYPEEVNWIKLKPNRIKKRYDILTKEEVGKMIEFAPTLRDKAIISVLWAGTRISELWNIRIDDIQWDEYGCVILVHGKTGIRPVRIVEYSGFLELYLKHIRHDSEWVWLTRDNYSKGHKLSRKAMRYMLRQVARMAGITKPVNPHNFRHSIATELSRHLSDAQLRIFFGWSQNSRSPSLYSHLSGRDVDQKMIELFYLKKEVKENHNVVKRIDEFV